MPRNNDDFCVLSPAARVPTPNHSHNVIKWKQAVISHPLSAICKFYCFIFCFVSLKEVSRSTIRKKVQITLTDDAKKLLVSNGDIGCQDLKFQRCLSLSSGTPDASLFVHGIGIKSSVVFIQTQRKIFMFSRRVATANRM